MKTRLLALSLALIALSGPAHAATLWVDNSPGGPGIFTATGGTQPAIVSGLTPGVDLFSTIGDAAAASSPGDLINVADGTYNEYVTVPNSVTIRGNNFGTPATRTHDHESRIVTSSGAFYVTSAAAAIDGFEADAGGCVVTSAGYGRVDDMYCLNNFVGFYVTGFGYLTFGSGNVVEGSTGYGIAFDDPAAYVLNNTLGDVHFVGFAEDPSAKLISLQNGALDGDVIDGSDAYFDGERIIDHSTSERIDILDHIDDLRDAPGVGLIDFALPVPKPGAKIKVSDSGDATKRKATFQIDQIDLQGQSPLGYNTALRIEAPHLATTAYLVLDAVYWVEKKPGQFQFKAPKDVSDTTIKAKLVDGGSMKVTIKGPGSLALGGVAQEEVSVTVAIGPADFCADFGGDISKDNGKAFGSTEAPAPVVCPAP